MGFNQDIYVTYLTYTFLASLIMCDRRLFNSHMYSYVHLCEFLSSPACLPLCLCRDHYIVCVKWVNADVLSVVWAVRAQNLSVVTHCSSPHSRSRRWRCSEARHFNLSLWLFGLWTLDFGLRVKLGWFVQFVGYTLCCTAQQATEQFAFN